MRNELPFVDSKKLQTKIQTDILILDIYILYY